MVFSIPIYVEERASAEGGAPSYGVRPLFYPECFQRAEKLGRALSKLKNDLRAVLYEAGREPRHDSLLKWTFHPELEETTVELRLELPSGSHRLHFFLASYTALGRKLYFTPSVPELHFELSPGQNLEERATAVFTRHFRELEKSDGRVNWDQYALRGKGRLATVEIALKPSVLAKKPARERRAWLMGNEEKMDGEQELRKTGQALQSLYPDDLERALGRDREIEELARALALPERRAILLVGPRMVGKTATLHELVRRMCERKKERYAGQHEIWHLSPMRLISGMSCLGQWENRVLAILNHARQKDLVLYYDDLPGLLTAGISSASNLNVAQVLRPALEKRQVRCLAEITPEAWRVLRERDRALADLFQVIPLAEPVEAETLRVLVHSASQWEEQYRCEYALEVVPAVYDLLRRFAGELAFPGKAASFLRRLAVRHAGYSLGRAEALAEFQAQSGLPLAFLDPRERLDRGSILQALRRELAGQDAALEAFADILIVLKARLNNPRRPLGALLLAGPTGTGKTQAAKVLSKYLFGEANRLVRFDMNEYGDAASAGRLAGTLDMPDGLLTSAIRRQPFSVVLFDEIEKAAPEVFDLLLAVLDEGRLADGLGRVASFTNAVILLTSNLGAREAKSQLGFLPSNASPGDQDAVFIQAAEKFFRPEFFNRLDRVIPFRPFAPSQLEQIAQQLIQDVMAREGLRRRDCLLEVTPLALSQLAEMGRNSQLGARALKRIVESQVAQPLAERLAALAPGIPLMARFDWLNQQLTLQYHELRPMEKTVTWPETMAAWPFEKWPALFAEVKAALRRIEAELDSFAPTGKIALDKLSSAAAHYYACREQAQTIRQLLQAVETEGNPRKQRVASASIPKAKPAKQVSRRTSGTELALDRQRENEGLQIDFADWVGGEAEGKIGVTPATICQELALLAAMARQPSAEGGVCILIRALDKRDAGAVFRLAQIWHDCWNHIWGVSADFVLRQFDPDKGGRQDVFRPLASQACQALFWQGIHLPELAPNASAIVRRVDGSAGVLLIQRQAAGSLKAAQALVKNMAAGASVADAPAGDEPGPLWLEIRETKSLQDFRTGLVIPSYEKPAAFRSCMLSALPLPPEVVP